MNTTLINIAWPIPENSRMPGTVLFIIQVTPTKVQVLTNKD